MKRKILLGTLSGVAAGVLDVIPMIIQKLPLHSLLSAFSMWMILGFIINTSMLKMKAVLKGLLLSLCGRWWRMPGQAHPTPICHS